MSSRSKALSKDFLAERYNEGRCIFAFLSANATRELPCFNLILSCTNCSVTVHGVDFVSGIAPGIVIMRSINLLVSFVVYTHACFGE